MEYTIQQAKDEAVKSCTKDFPVDTYEYDGAGGSMCYIRKDVAEKTAELYASKLREADRKRIEELTEVLESVIRLAPLLEYPDSAAESPYKSEAQAVHKMLQSCKSALNL